MMKEKEAAEKLKARVDDWQSYLGKAENPWAALFPDSPARESAAPQRPSATVESPPLPPPTVHQPGREETPLIVEQVAPAAVAPVQPGPLAATGAGSQSAPRATVVEVLPPETKIQQSPRPPKKSASDFRRHTEARLHSVLFGEEA